MAESTFEQFEVRWQNADGTETPLSGVTLQVWSVEQGSTIHTVATDGNGIVVPEVLGAAVGDVLRFRLENYEGRAWFIAKPALPV